MSKTACNKTACNKVACERSSHATLTEEGKEELALAILLLRDYKVQDVRNEQDKFNLIAQIIYFAKALGITEQFDKAMAQYPVFKITYVQR